MSGRRPTVLLDQQTPWRRNQTLGGVRLVDLAGDAAAEGRTTFESPWPCPKCGGTVRITASMNCPPCTNKRRRARRAERNLKT